MGSTCVPMIGSYHSSCHLEKRPDTVGHSISIPHRYDYCPDSPYSWTFNEGTFEVQFSALGG